MAKYYALQAGRIDLSHAASRGPVDETNLLAIADRILNIREDADVDTVTALADHPGHDRFEAGYLAILSRDDAPFRAIDRPGLFREPIDADHAASLLATRKASILRESACGRCHPDKVIGYK